MFLRVNGLFGWIQTNDRRSVALFAGFVAALNVGAALALYLPLAAFDPENAPVFAWGGYLTHYAPLVTLCAVVVFALQILWHIRSVRRLVGFEFVDTAAEPRLLRIVEPLAIAMGLPMPRVGVIETTALNAFACGYNRANAAIVVTRGLIDGLDDDELASVVAHELAHIANGDIRLLAAANVCLRMIGWLVKPRKVKPTRLQELVSFSVVMLVMPPLYLFLLAVSFAAQSALRSAHLVRLLITSSREFIADATAVQITQNPSALVSALERVQGRSSLVGLPPGQDAMMIDGATDGSFATHPTIARRIAALVAVTGSMALVAPARRDTRAGQPLPRPADRSIRASACGLSLSSGRRGEPPQRVEMDDRRNWLGLTPTMTVGALLALVVFFGMHRRDLGDPAALVAALDPRSSSAFMAVAARGAGCSVAVIASRTIGMTKPERCTGTAMHDFTVAQAKVSGPVGAMLTAMTTAPEGMYVWPDGHFSNVPPPGVEATEVRTKRCFRTRPYAPGDRGLHSLDEKPRADGSFDLRRWLARTEALAIDVATSRPGQRDALLKRYVEARKTNYETIHHFFGGAGIELANQSFSSPAHNQARLIISERLRDLTSTTSLSPLELAEADLLANNPGDFVSCVARFQQ